MQARRTKLARLVFGVFFSGQAFLAVFRDSLHASARVKKNIIKNKIIQEKTREMHTFTTDSTSSLQGGPRDETRSYAGGGGPSARRRARAGRRPAARGLSAAPAADPCRWRCSFGPTQSTNWPFIMDFVGIHINYLKTISKNIS